MLRKIAIGLGVLVVALVATAATLYHLNSVPSLAAIPASEAAQPSRHFVVKLHANWCSVCLATKDEWLQLVKDYSGKVNLLVFDSTNDSTIAASQAEADRLGLGKVLEQYQGASGMVLVLEPRGRTIVAELAGMVPLEHYRAAIDKAITAAPM